MKLNKKNKFISSIFGCSTYSRNFLAQNVYLPETKIGDYVIIGNAGSYSASAHTKFLGFDEVTEIII